MRRHATKVKRHARPPADSRFENEMKKFLKCKTLPGERVSPFLFQPHSMNGIFFSRLDRLEADRDQRNE